MNPLQAFLTFALVLVIVCIALLKIGIWFPRRCERSATTQTVKEKYEPGELKSKKNERLRLKLIQLFHGVEE